MKEYIYRIRPTETDAYLANPHKGCCTFQNFNGDEFFSGTSWSEEGPLEFPVMHKSGTGYDAEKYYKEINTCGRWDGVRNGYLPSTVAYCRWFWNVLESEEGKYDFSMIDGSLERCRQTGQTLAVRLMAHGAPGQPEVPEWYREKYAMIDSANEGIQYCCPEHDSDEYFEHFGNLIRAFAERYDGNPLLESIDVAFVGPWGEGAGKYSRKRCEQFVELWEEAFKITPRLSLIGGIQFAEGIKHGCGWRADCFGDVAGSDKIRGNALVPGATTWNHMYDCYPAAICNAGAGDVWKHAPVHLETCSVPMDWYQAGCDIEWIIKQGKKYHATYFMPKYTRLPDEWLPALRRFCSRLGYRFVFRQAVVKYSDENEKTLNLQIWIENIGVAPIYCKYDFAIRLRQGDKDVILLQKDIDIRNWLPGDVCLDLTHKIPELFESGMIEIAAGIVDDTQQAKVSFAACERFIDRWLPLGAFCYIKSNS